MSESSGLTVTSTVWLMAVPLAKIRISNVNNLFLLLFPENSIYLPNTPLDSFQLNLTGAREDICKSTLPKTSEQLKLESSSITAGKWTIYLIVAIFVTMLITAIVTFGITMFCCNSNKSQSRTVSPMS